MIFHLLGKLKYLWCIFTFSSSSYNVATEKCEVRHVVDIEPPFISTGVMGAGLRVKSLSAQWIHSTCDWLTPSGKRHAWQSAPAWQSRLWSLSVNTNTLPRNVQVPSPPEHWSESSSSSSIPRPLSCLSHRGSSFAVNILPWQPLDAAGDPPLPAA